MKLQPRFLFLTPEDLRNSKSEYTQGEGYFQNLQLSRGVDKQKKSENRVNKK